MNKILLNTIRVILITIIILICNIIFGFSNQDGTQSKGVSGKVARILIEIQPRYKEIDEIKKEELIEKYQKFVRKGAHFSIYTVLGMSITGLMCTYKLTNKKRIYISLIFGIVYACSDEIHQIFIEGRSAQVTDVLIDTLGIIFGIIIVIGTQIIIKKRFKTS